MSPRASRPTAPLRVRLQIRALRQWKRLVHRLRPYRRPSQTVVFVAGAARSGTSAMVRIFERDVRTTVFGEGHRGITTAYARGLRPLKPLPELQAVLRQAPTSLVILKPLADLHNLSTLLECFAGSKCIWLYRQYKDVIQSNLTKWGETNGIRNLRFFAETQALAWPPGVLPAPIRAAALERYAEGMNRYDAAALMWLVRNGLLFGMGLDQSPAVALCRYEHLILQPAQELRQLYAFLGHPYPGDHIVREIHSSAAGKGARLELSPDVDSLCQDLLDRLDRLPRLPPPGPPG